MKKLLSSFALALSFLLTLSSAYAVTPVPYDPVVYNGRTYYIQTYYGTFNSPPSGSVVFNIIGGTAAQDIAGLVGNDFGTTNFNFTQANTGAGPSQYGPIFTTFQSGGFAGGYAYNTTTKTTEMAIGNVGSSYTWAYYTNSAPAGGYSVGAPEIDGSLAPKVGFLLGCLFLMFGRKKQNTESLLSA
ncbi:hypothetical protein [Polynucleobacter sp. P1-05-14]|uniref:hypothetical protein n=1 Tax=Polynucleobacter sp. P1-05-14 TaxID=1819732 RepID=UPI001C0E11DF|nr:hypothetical protein [Polynucleobacter sp. P1-05-14]MBU3548038.1 hypothetical protein [Polynucleobacter sp. P1-05-14]